MSNSTNRIRSRRLARQWSQAELAQRVGVSRSAISAIEAERLAPSVTAALALAQVFGCTVEELFGAASSATSTEPTWAWTPPADPWRYWEATVGKRRMLFPAEPTSYSEHDGILVDGARQPRKTVEAERTLVLACCDPAAGLLATRLAATAGIRLLTYTRSSQESLALLQQGLVHVAGVHLSKARSAEGNSSVVRRKLGSGFSLLRLAHWQEGIAVSPHLKIRSVRAALDAKLRWIGREPGSGARQCLDELLGDRTVTRFARHHRGVAEAIRDGWGDAGVCLRLASAEVGLDFIPVREERYDLCFSTESLQDPRILALQSLVRSPSYRRVLGDLPGYAVAATGELEHT